MHQFSSAGLLILGLLGAPNAWAQGPNSADTDRGPRFLLASAAGDERLPVDVHRTPSLRRRISVSFEGVTLKQALDEISQQGNLRLMYSRHLVPLESRVQLKAENITVAGALSEVLMDTGVDVLMTPDGRAALVKRPPATPLQEGVIVGRVIETRTDAPLPGAVVEVIGTRLSTTSGDDGRYRIAGVPVGTHTARARFIGYSAASASVTVRSDQETTLDFSLERSPLRLEQVVVTGTVVPTEVKAIPTPTSVVTAEDIERSNVRRIGSLLREMAPGFLSPDQGPFAEGTPFSARGAASLLPGSGSVKVYLDGVQIAVQTAAAVDPKSIERIELVRGPQAATIYGSDALGGVLQIFTKRGDSRLTRPEISAQATLGVVQSQFAGSGALHQDYAALVRGGASGASYHLGGGYVHTGEWVPEYYLSNPSVWGGIQAGQGALRFDLSGRFYQQVYGRPFDPRQVASGSPFFSVPSYERAQSREETYGARLAYTTGNWGWHSLTVGVDRLGLDNYNTRARLTTEADSLRRLVVGNRRRTTAAYNTTLSAPLARAVSANLTLGVDHYNFKDDLLIAQTSSISGTVRPATGIRTVTTNTGYFAQGQVGIADAVFLTGGIRAESNSDFGDDLGTPISPRVGVSLVRTIGSTSLKVRGSYGEVVRPPAPGQKNPASFSSQTNLVNPNLGPERQTGFDTGVDLFFGAKGSVGVTYYNQTARDLIQHVLLETTASGEVRQYQNVGRVKNTGLEVEGTLTMGVIELSAQYALTRSRVRDLGPSYGGDLIVGEQVFLVPEHTAGARATVRPLSGTNLTAGFAYVGSKTFYDNVAILQCSAGTGACQPLRRDYLIDYPGFAKFNFSASQRITPFLSGLLTVENLTNNHADEFTNTSPVQGRITSVGFRFTR